MIFSYNFQDGRTTLSNSDLKPLQYNVLRLLGWTYIIVQDNMADMNLRETRSENYGKCFEMDLQVTTVFFTLLH